MRTPIQIAQEYVGSGMIDQLAKDIEDYGEKRYSDGHGTGYGNGSRDATIRANRGY